MKIEKVTWSKIQVGDIIIPVRYIQDEDGRWIDRGLQTMTVSEIRIHRNRPDGRPTREYFDADGVFITSAFGASKISRVIS